MSRIQILPDSVSSKIAAGEVIERPASIIRELLDNCLDSEATKIEVRFEEGGKNLIRISDNGNGMSKEDLLLCTERHATSKISCAEDLFSISSFGFRGEALASISAVSRLTIASMQSDSDVGYCMEADAGKILGINEVSMLKGTAVTVKNLFFNVPARLKFLRNAKTEASYIIDTSIRSILPFSNVQFQLADGEKILLRFPSTSDFTYRLAEAFGKTVIKEMLHTDSVGGHLSIEVFLSPPAFAKSRPDKLLIYVNGRNIKDRLLFKAVTEGYGQRLMKGAYPVGTVFIRIEPSMVDVNVHPAKHEVRFPEPGYVYNAVKETVASLFSAEVYVSSPMDKSDNNFFPEQQLSENTQINYIAETGNMYHRTNYNYSYKPEPKYINNSDKILSAADINIIGQLGNIYILVQDNDGLIVIDQHAAHERIVYENLKDQIEKTEVLSQTLLIPRELELSINDARLLEKKLDLLKKFGFDIEFFGGSTFLIRSVPMVLSDIDAAPVIMELLSTLNSGSFEQLFDRIITSMACHSSVRKGRALAKEEIEKLIIDLSSKKIPDHCPHGRPIVWRLTYKELDKIFKRIL